MSNLKYGQLVRITLPGFYEGARGVLCGFSDDYEGTRFVVRFGDGDMVGFLANEVEALVPLQSAAISDFHFVRADLMQLDDENLLEGPHA
jgi:hypothetical protein